MIPLPLDLSSAPDPDRDCRTVARALDGKPFECIRPVGHAGDHYGRDDRGPVILYREIPARCGRAVAHAAHRTADRPGWCAGITAAGLVESRP